MASKLVHAGPSACKHPIWTTLLYTSKKVDIHSKMREEKVNKDHRRWFFFYQLAKVWEGFTWQNIIRFLASFTTEQWQVIAEEAFVETTVDKLRSVYYNQLQSGYGHCWNFLVGFLIPHCNYLSAMFPDTWELLNLWKHYVVYLFLKVSVWCVSLRG